MTDRFAPAVKILQDHQYDSAKLIPILQKVQDEYTYLPEDIMRFVANELDISPAKVFGVATFFCALCHYPKRQTHYQSVQRYGLPRQGLVLCY